MAVGFKGTVANSLLGAVLKATSYTGPSNLYAQLHTGDPGANGTSNTSTAYTGRVAITFGTASGGSITNNAAVDFTSAAAGSVTHTHISIWDASSSGNFIASGTVTSNAVSVGDTLQLASGAVTVSLNVAA
jgi:hypothetical protein